MLGRKRGTTSGGSRSRMSASAMQALELFHSRAVAVSNTPASLLDGMNVLSFVVINC